MNVLMLFWQPAMLLSTCFMLLLVILMANEMIMILHMSKNRVGLKREWEGKQECELSFSPICGVKWG